MLIYLGQRVVVGFFASYDLGCCGDCSWVCLMTWCTAQWSCEMAAKSSHCGKRGWTRLFALAYTRPALGGINRLGAGQFKQHRYQVFEMAADKFFYCGVYHGFGHIDHCEINLH